MHGKSLAWCLAHCKDLINVPYYYNYSWGLSPTQALTLKTPLARLLVYQMGGLNQMICKIASNSW